MTLNLYVLTPNRIVWDLEVKEIILSTNSGQIGVLPNHAPITTSVDIGILRIRLNDQWLTMALMGGFARIGNNKITILVNDAEKNGETDPQEAQQTRGWFLVTRAGDIRSENADMSNDKSYEKHDRLPVEGTECTYRGIYV
ncbi:unnamed protein product [Lactuca virosa]|uniref:ATP synthase F1 complex delta/epsilon subunit N-terminal domain-containing protein n=1 Tax=Lactuca virosa TaxID=75947 RepID=A0AAU9M7C1_9ASTR|nr:unnamed protein product [Lactuca virosa]